MEVQREAVQWVLHVRQADVIYEPIKETPSKLLTTILTGLLNKNDLFTRSKVPYDKTWRKSDFLALDSTKQIHHNPVKPTTDTSGMHLT